MSPRSKRTREEEEEDDDASDVESVLSLSNKRARRNDDDDESTSSTDDEMESPLRTINPSGKPPEAGVIKRVYVENFMCHRKLTVDLCRNVNFIHGQNGSGKSAILAAIQICLGAGARRTHRARNLKELVRKEAGQHCCGAKVRVTLLNGGPDGFQPDVYGDTITVERSISLRSGGSNGYKLLDHEGRMKSNSKKDLDLMLDQLNIQVENPVAVLDQEESKKFLIGTPEEKYTFMAKATELERMDRSYASVVDNITELEENKTRVKESLASKVENVKKLKKEWEQYQALGKLEKKVLNYRVDYAWAFYNEVQEEVDIEQNKLDDYNAKKERRVQELTQMENPTSGPDQEQQRKEERLTQLTEEAQQATEMKRKLEADLKRAQAPIKAMERNIKTVHREVSVAGRNLQDAKRALQEERERILAAAGESEEAERAATLKEAEAEQDELNEKITQLKQSVTDHQRKYEEMDPSIDQTKAQVDSLRRQLQGIQGKLGQLESGDSDKLAAFGRSCSQVDRLVKQAHREGRWTGPVAGPIGAHIQIASGKEDYATVAEHALGGKSLDRFVVTNDRDRMLFQQIRERANCNSNECGIYQVADSPRYRVPPPPSADVETVASCLNVDNDLIFNAMVDHLRIDQCAVSKSKEASERSLLVQDSRGRLSIRGGTIRQVYFLPHGDRWTVGNGNLSLTSNSQRLKQTLGIDRSAAIAELKVEASQLSHDQAQHKERQTQLEREQKDAQKKWNTERRRAQKAQDRLEELADKINQVRAESEESANVTIDTTELEEDVSSAEENLDALKEQLTEKERQLEDLYPTVEDVKNRLTEVTARNEKVLTDALAAEEDLQRHLQNKTQREEKMQKTKRKLQAMDEVIVKQEANVKTMEDDRDKALLKARELHYRRDAERTRQGISTQPTQEELVAIKPVETGKEPAYYESKIERAKNMIEEEKRHRRLAECDPQVACEKYMRAQADLDGSMKQIDAIDKNVALQTSDVKDRRKKWRMFRQHIVDISNDTFNDILNKKGSSGEIDVSHADRTLDVIVQKDNTQESTQTDDVKALSGGERSYATLALLLALGESLETPFRVMDEFDVFLDGPSRAQALDELVRLGKGMVNRQFIFITPQDISSLRTDPLLKIHYMKPPAREGRVGGPSQGTLDFSQASDE